MLFLFVWKVEPWNYNYFQAYFPVSHFEIGNVPMSYLSRRVAWKKRQNSAMVPTINENSVWFAVRDSILIPWITVELTQKYICSVDWILRLRVTSQWCHGVLNHRLFVQQIVQDNKGNHSSALLPFSECRISQWWPSNAKRVSMTWRHHSIFIIMYSPQISHILSKN